MLRSLITRSQARTSWLRILCGSLTGTAVVTLISVYGGTVGHPLLVAAFGSSCVLVFTLPDSPLSQPVNVIGGHVIGAVVGIAGSLLLPVAPWSLGLAVGVALAAMAALRMTHPPAGGAPIAIMLANEHWFSLVPLILGGAVIIALGGSLYRLAFSAAARHRDRALVRAEVARKRAAAEAEEDAHISAANTASIALTE
ncbi:HPP family protein [Leucobacter japonicus]|uniref:HPP family protein n=1 Tax=Leucobacter japonicus TaxID=1461259 RepID=UPI000B06AD3D|nr:HPP family protein [Leucobacter japonicus]